MKPFWLVLVMACLLLSGCARHAPAPGTMKYVIGSECHPVVILQGCDSASPPHCATSTVKYDSDCEQVVVE